MCNAESMKSPIGGHETWKSQKRSSLKPVFQLSVLCNCRDMAVQHGGHCKREAALSADIKAYCKVI